MSNLTNHATLLGTVSSEPEFHQRDDGSALLRFEVTTVRVGEAGVERRETHPVAARDVFARRLHGKLARGHQVLCEGSLRSTNADGVRSAAIEASIVHDLGLPGGAERASRNGVVLMGNVGGTPEFKNAGESALLVVRLATKAHDEEETEWHTLKIWGSRATALERILASGDKLAVSGEVRHERYTDGRGAAQHVIAVHAHEIQLMGRSGGPTAA